MSNAFALREILGFIGISSGVLIGYVYIGYPLILWMLSRMRNKPVRKGEITPSVSLIISAYNEENNIGKKIENSLALEYPKECLELLVVSDSSSDRTDDIVNTFSSKGVTLIRLPGRSGKSTGLNRAMEVAEGEIIIFSDANILYRPDVIQLLVNNFSDPEVGCVTGDSQYISQDSSSAHNHEDRYWGYERNIKAWESAIGSMVGGDGAIFGIRKVLFTPLAPEAINDFLIPLEIVSRGYRAVFEPGAVGIEESAGDFRGEFKRKQRIVNRSWNAIMSIPGILNPMKMGFFALQVWSHKVLRWLILFFIFLFVAGCMAAYPVSIAYQIGVIGFFLSLFFVFVGSFSLQRTGMFFGFANLIYYFYMVNVAALIGVFRAARGKVEVIWSPERS